jgi:hypothetical protein
MFPWRLQVGADNIQQRKSIHAHCLPYDYLDYVHATNIINPTQNRINSEKYTFCVVNSLELLKNLKTN